MKTWELIRWSLISVLTEIKWLANISRKKGSISLAEKGAFIEIEAPFKKKKIQNQKSSSPEEWKQARYWIMSSYTFLVFENINDHNLFKLSLLFWLLFITFGYLFCWGGRVSQLVRRSEDNLWQLVLFFCCLGCGDRTRVHRFGSKYFNYLACHRLNIF